MKKRFLLFILISLSLLSFSSLSLAMVRMQDISRRELFLHARNAAGTQDDAVSDALGLPESITRYIAERQHENLGAPVPRPAHETYGSSLCSSPAYTCIPVKSYDTWYQLWPDPHKREIVMRLNRTNVALKYRHWLLVPKHLGQEDYMYFSPLPDHMKKTGHSVLLIDLGVFAFGAYNADGDLVYWGPATGGQKWCSDTNKDCETAVGTFKIYRKQGEACQSSKYPLDENGGAPMPFCMHYYKGFAIHASTLSGFNNRSRGCVRLFYSDAKWLNQHFAKLGTEVVVRR